MSVCARHSTCLLCYHFQITEETTQVERVELPNEWLKEGTRCWADLRGHGIWCAQGPHTLPNVVTMPPAELRECDMCLGFPAHNSATSWGLDPFSKPGATGSKLGRPLPSNAANHPEPYCLGPPECHWASERLALPDRFVSSFLPEARLGTSYLWAHLAFRGPLYPITKHNAQHWAVPPTRLGTQPNVSHAAGAQ